MGRRDDEVSVPAVSVPAAESGLVDSGATSLGASAPGASAPGTAAEGVVATPPDWRVHAALIIVQVLFGAFSVIGKVALAEIPPLVLAGARAVFAAVVFQTWMSAAGRERIASRADYAALCLYALLGITINQLCFLFGLARTTAINATVLIATIPVFTLLAAALLGRERLTARKGMGVALSFLGVFLLVGADAMLLQRELVTGNVLIVVNSLSYGLYLVLSRSLLERYRAFTVIGWVFTFGALFTLPLAVVPMARLDWQSLSPTAWMALGYVLVFPTVIAYFLNSWALKRASASLVAVYINLQPLVAVTGAVWFLGESAAAWVVASGLLVLAGVAMTGNRAAAT